MIVELGGAITLGYLIVTLVNAFFKHYTDVEIKI